LGRGWGTLGKKNGRRGPRRDGGRGLETATFAGESSYEAQGGPRPGGTAGRARGVPSTEGAFSRTAGKAGETGFAGPASGSHRGPPPRKLVAPGFSFLTRCQKGTLRNAAGAGVLVARMNVCVGSPFGGRHEIGRPRRPTASWRVGRAWRHKKIPATPFADIHHLFVGSGASDRVGTGWTL